MTLHLSTPRHSRLVHTTTPAQSVAVMHWLNFYRQKIMRFEELRIVSLWQSTTIKDDIIKNTKVNLEPARQPQERLDKITIIMTSLASLKLCNVTANKAAKQLPYNHMSCLL